MSEAYEVPISSHIWVWYLYTGGWSLKLIIVYRDKSGNKPSTKVTSPGTAIPKNDKYMIANDKSAPQLSHYRHYPQCPQSPGIPHSFIPVHKMTELCVFHVEQTFISCWMKLNSNKLFWLIWHQSDTMIQFYCHKYSGYKIQFIFTKTTFLKIWQAYGNPLEIFRQVGDICK